MKTTIPDKVEVDVEVPRESLDGMMEFTAAQARLVGALRDVRRIETRMRSLALELEAARARVMNATLDATCAFYGEAGRQ